MRWATEGRGSRVWSTNLAARRPPPFPGRRPREPSRGARCTPRRMGARVWGGKERGVGASGFVGGASKNGGGNWSGDLSEPRPRAPHPRPSAARARIQKFRAGDAAAAPAPARLRAPGARGREPSLRAARVGLGIRTCAAHAWRAARVSRVSRFTISFFSPKKVQNQFLLSRKSSQSV